MKLVSKSFLSSRIFSRKMLQNFPEFFEPLFVGPKKSCKIPAKFPAKLPSQNSNKIHRRASPVSSKNEGDRAPRNHPEISRQKLADFECRFPHTSYGRDRAPSWPFLGERFWGNILRPLVLPGPFVLLLIQEHREKSSWPCAHSPERIRRPWACTPKVASSSTPLKPTSAPTT